MWRLHVLTADLKFTSSPWSNTAAEISGPNPAWFRLMEPDARDDKQDQRTQRKGTPASNYGCCRLAYVGEHLEMVSGWNEPGCALKTTANTCTMKLLKWCNKLSWLIISLISPSKPTQLPNDWNKPSAALTFSYWNSLPNRYRYMVDCSWNTLCKYTI
jgi:hypothetical protein